MSERIGIIAGNKLLPVLLSKTIKESHQQMEVIAFCFKGESSPQISRYADKVYWLDIASLSGLREAIKEEKLESCIMAGQITPRRIFRRKNWDKELSMLVESSQDLRPHTIFSQIIAYLERLGVHFLDSTLYLKECLATNGVMASSFQSEEIKEEIAFGVKIISRFVDLDIGQTAVIKNKSVVALEALEGTDNTIRRGFNLAGRGCVILKFSKSKQDFRFDVPVVGLATLTLLRKIKALALVLESNRVIILEKEKFLTLAKKWQIPIIGCAKA